MIGEERREGEGRRGEKRFEGGPVWRGRFRRICSSGSFLDLEFLFLFLGGCWGLEGIFLFGTTTLYVYR